MASGVAVPTKPPNVLVLWPSDRFTSEESIYDDYAFNEVRDELVSCINSECYVIYPLTREKISQTPWKENCSLLILPPALLSKPSEPRATEIYREVMSYLRHHSGRVLSMDFGFNSLLGFPIPEGKTICRDHMFKVTVHGRTGSDESGNKEGLSFDTLGVAYTPEQIAEQLAERDGREEKEEEHDAHTDLPSSLGPTTEEGGRKLEEGGEVDTGAAVCSGDDILAHVELSESHQLADSSPGGDPVTAVPCVRRLSFGESGSAVLCHVDLLPVLSVLSGILMRVDAMMTLSKSTESRRDFLMSVLRSTGTECRPHVTPQLTQGYLVCSTGVSVALNQTTLVWLS